tara:strand:+ start:173 stop:562 length:390 start_codon:yes stop_codon:yes gene_type:complete
MNKRKYKSIAIDINCYKKIDDLSTTLTPGLTLSKAQVVRTLVNQKSSGRKDTSYTIVSLFSEYTPQERQEILQDIDKKILMLLDLSEDELPWLNSNENFDEKWSSIIDDIRLVVSKFKYEKLQNERSVN